MAAPVLNFDDLGGGYGDTRVLRGVSGSVRAGEVLGVMGRNGVGKTTLMRLLMGYLSPMSGRVLLRGEDVTGWPTHRRQQAGMSHVPQERLVFDPLTVRDNLTLHRRERTLAGYEPLFEVFPRLRERLSLPAGRLSGGEKKLVGFARALAEQAPVTLLDEPSEGVQQENIERMAALIAQRRAQGGAFVIVEQNFGFLQAVMDEVIVLDHGDVVLAGRADAFGREQLLSHLQV